MWGSIGLLIFVFCKSFSFFYVVVLSFCLTMMFFTSMSFFVDSKIFTVSFKLLMDSFSFFLVMLTLWMSLLMFLAMPKNLYSRGVFLNMSMLFLNKMLLFAFLSYEFLFFFVFFEFSLLPTLMLILGWGVQPERLQAGSYLMIYTFLGSLPLLVSFCYYFYFSYSTNMFLWLDSKKSFLMFWKSHDASWMSLFWFLGFFIKLPVYGVHLWLPKAHVEAPVVGSMVLAGVLLKLGAYGLVRLSPIWHMNFISWMKIGNFWFLVSMCMVGFVCFRQKDLKSLVAYSSMAHMTLVASGVMVMSVKSWFGILYMLMAHGMCSSGLFFMVKIFYELSGSRNILFNRGFLVVTPLLVFFWFLLCVSKSSAPPSLNLFSEMLLMYGMSEYSLFKLFFCFISMFVAGLFSMYLYVLVSHGKWKKLKFCWFYHSFRQSLNIFLHIVPIYFLIFFCSFLV